jgi:hypothetical protein
LSKSAGVARHCLETQDERSLVMCPACIAAAAITAAKVASVGGLAAYGVKKLVNRASGARAKDGPENRQLVNPLPPLGVTNEENSSRVR